MFSRTSCGKRTGKLWGGAQTEGALQRDERELSYGTMCSAILEGTLRSDCGPWAFALSSAKTCRKFMSEQAARG